MSHLWSEIGTGLIQFIIEQLFTYLSREWKLLLFCFIVILYSIIKAIEKKIIKTVIYSVLAFEATWNFQVLIPDSSSLLITLLPYLIGCLFAGLLIANDKNSPSIISTTILSSIISSAISIPIVFVSNPIVLEEFHFFEIPLIIIIPSMAFFTLINFVLFFIFAKLKSSITFS